MGVLTAVGLKKAASRSPSREALAVAINELTGLARSAAKAANAVERAASIRDQARQNYDNVAGKARAARDQHAADMMRAARSGEEVLALSGAREQKYAEIDASEALQTAEGVVEALQGEHDELQRRLQDGHNKLDGLAKAVVAEECFEPVYAACEAATLAFNRQIAVAAVVQGCIPGPTNEAFQKLRTFSEHRPLMTTLMVQGATQPDTQLIRAMWKEARASLARNPDAPLPSIEGEIDDDRSVA